MTLYNGTEVVMSMYMTELKEDWSGCRSPARAARRLRRGFPQRMVVRSVPRADVLIANGKMFVHPETWRRLVKTEAFARAYSSPTGLRPYQKETLRHIGQKSMVVEWPRDSGKSMVTADYAVIENRMLQLMKAQSTMMRYVEYARSIGCEIMEPDSIVCTQEQSKLLSKWWERETGGQSGKT